MVVGRGTATTGTTAAAVVEGRTAGAAAEVDGGRRSGAVDVGDTPVGAEEALMGGGEVVEGAAICREDGVGARPLTTRDTTKQRRVQLVYKNYHCKRCKKRKELL